MAYVRACQPGHEGVRWHIVAYRLYVVSHGSGTFIRPFYVHKEESMRVLICALFMALAGMPGLVAAAAPSNQELSSRADALERRIERLERRERTETKVERKAERKAEARKEKAKEK